MSIRFRDHFFPPHAVRDTALITGFPARVPQRHIIDAVDPVSGEATPLAVFHYPATAPSPEEPAEQLVMVHGFRGDHHGLALVVDALPEYDIWVPDLPGFGQSPQFPSAPHRSQDFATVVNQLPDLLGLRAPWLVGHSFGSIVASYAVSQAPEQMWTGIALLNPIARPALHNDGSFVDRAGTVVTAGFYQVCAALPSALGRWVLSAPLMVWATGFVMSETQNPRVLAYTHEQHQEYFSAFDTPESVLEAYQASISTTVADVSNHISGPVLLIAGAKDPLASVEEQQSLAESFPSSAAVQLRVIERTGHLMHYETPVEIATMLREFITGA